MSNTIQGLPPIDPARFQPEVQKSSSSQSEFLNTLQKTLDQAQQIENEADSKVTDLISGKGQDVHSAMIAVEKADISFQLIMQVRNKIVKAYQDISGLQF
jgi:flagellar hook-basal body complex protein FliE